MKNWKVYERLVALLIHEEYINQDFYSVIPNAKVTGLISGRKRQLDILIDCRFDSDLTRRIIIDSKLHKRPIDIKQIESFEGLMKDVGAKIGYIVCSNGHTKAALKRAQELINIRIIKEDDLDEFDLNSWDRCKSPKCSKGLILWDKTPGIFHDGTVTIQALGKCDECGKFQIWCWGCGNKHCIEYEDEWRCSCEDRKWFWITTIEPDEDDNGTIYKSHYLILVYFNASWDILDKRPI